MEIYPGFKIQSFEKIWRKNNGEKVQEGQIYNVVWHCS